MAERSGRLGDRVRELGLRVLYRIGWRVGPRVPRVVSRLIIEGGSRYALRRDGWHVAQLRRNLSVAGGRPADDELVRAGLASYLRNFLEVLALPGWTRERVLDRVRIENRAVLDAAVAGRGAVVALPHSGNWDLAGAWACLSGMPVSTVAEQLNGPEFAAFLAFRESLGMQIVSHRDPAAIRILCDAVAAGRVVCLVADRDLVRSGVPVRWGSDGPLITMPAGPAMVARLTGAALIPCVARFVGRDVGAGMIMTLGDPITHRPGRSGLTAMTAEVAEFFAREIAEQPQDWHLLQPFFPEPSTGSTS
ncbi:MAG: phosphatidylinositol mannoside acyltransferase [Propionibacteriaceae bacterium]